MRPKYLNRSMVTTVAALVFWLTGLPSSATPITCRSPGEAEKREQTVLAAAKEHTSDGKELTETPPHCCLVERYFEPVAANPEFHLGIYHWYLAPVGTGALEPDFASAVRVLWKGDAPSEMRSRSFESPCQRLILPNLGSVSPGVPKPNSGAVRFWRASEDGSETQRAYRVPAPPSRRPAEQGGQWLRQGHWADQISEAHLHLSSISLPPHDTSTSRVAVEEPSPSKPGLNTAETVVESPPAAQGADADDEPVVFGRCDPLPRLGSPCKSSQGVERLGSIERLVAPHFDLSENIGRWSLSPLAGMVVSQGNRRATTCSGGQFCWLDDLDLDIRFATDRFRILSLGSPSAQPIKHGAPPATLLSLDDPLRERAISAVTFRHMQWALERFDERFPLPPRDKPIQVMQHIGTLGLECKASWDIDQIILPMMCRGETLFEPKGLCKEIVAHEVSHQVVTQVLQLSESLQFGAPALGLGEALADYLAAAWQEDPTIGRFCSSEARSLVPPEGSPPVAGAFTRVSSDRWAAMAQALWRLDPKGSDAPRPQIGVSLPELLLTSILWGGMDAVENPESFVDHLLRLAGDLELPQEVGDSISDHLGRPLPPTFEPPLGRRIVALRRGPSLELTQLPQDAKQAPLEATTEPNAGWTPVPPAEDGSRIWRFESLDGANPRGDLSGVFLRASGGEDGETRPHFVPVRQALDPVASDLARFQLPFQVLRPPAGSETADIVLTLEEGKLQRWDPESKKPVPIAGVEGELLYLLPGGRVIDAVDVDGERRTFLWTTIAEELSDLGPQSRLLSHGELLLLQEKDAPLQQWTPNQRFEDLEALPTDLEPSSLRLIPGDHGAHLYAETRDGASVEMIFPGDPQTQPTVRSADTASPLHVEATSEPALHWQDSDGGDITLRFADDPCAELPAHQVLLASDAAEPILWIVGVTCSGKIQGLDRNAEEEPWRKDLQGWRLDTVSPLIQIANTDLEPDRELVIGPFATFDQGEAILEVVLVHADGSAPLGQSRLRIADRPLRQILPADWDGDGCDEILLIGDSLEVWDPNTGLSGCR